MLTWNIINEYVDNGLVTKRKHPEFDYWILNYTAKVQFKRLWDDVTLNCRGLILDKNLNIIAKPFPKFFNYEELIDTKLSEQFPIPNLPYRIYDKVDGSLGIMYRGPDKKYYIASRGSFDSEQAIEGTQLLHDVWDKISTLVYPGITYLFEIIYPENRIVVDYGYQRYLVYIGSYDYYMNRDVTDYYYDLWPMEKVVRYPTTYSLNNIRDFVPGNNKEGFVVLFENGFRLKIKYEEYVKLHRVISTYNNDKFIWECLKDGVNIEEMVDGIPDEYYQEINLKITDLKNEYNVTKDYYERVFSETTDLLKDGTRKEYAQIFKQSKYPGILFKMLDGKDYSELIWKAIQPE